MFDPAREQVHPQPRLEPVTDSDRQNQRIDIDIAHRLRLHDQWGPHKSMAQIRRATIERAALIRNGSWHLTRMYENPWSRLP